MKKSAAKSTAAKKAVPQKTTPRSGQAARPLQLRAATAKQVQVKHLKAPPKYVRRTHVHRRHLLPLIREGRERMFHSASTRTLFHSPISMAAATPLSDDLVLAVNTELTQAGQNDTAANVGEPSAVVNGDVVLYTGNWYAAMSSDGGQTFQYIDPAGEFAAYDPPDCHFCCDQVVNYIAAIDTFVWLLQYGSGAGDNLQRLAFAKTADVIAGRWRLFDLTTAILGVPGAFLDFPDLAVGATCLYVTTNIFNSDGSAGSAVVRIPFDGIQSGQPVVQPYVSMNLQSFRVAQNCGAVAYFAAHQDSSTLAVFSWPESDPAPTQTLVGVSRWLGGNGYRSRCPDDSRWLDRADPRITGATMAGSELWFAWTVDAGSNQRPNPFVQIARINAQDLTLLENVNLFDPDSAIAYAGLSSNADDEVGVSYVIGGGPRYPSHVVGILTNTRRDVVVDQGERGPLADPQTGKGEWGDYLTVRPAFPDRKSFTATGYTMRGAGDGSNRDATPRWVVFGRASPVVPPDRRPKPPAGVSIPAGGPITDVNKLPIVAPAVAARILKAAGIPAQPQAAAPERAQAAPAGAPELVTKPGTERWAVKTGQDSTRNDVGRNVIGGQDLGAGIVVATVEELVAAPRPQDMSDVSKLYPAYDKHRAEPFEAVIFRLDVTITAMKVEADGDYHLVLQGASGETMIGEIPTPTKPFVGDSPWLANIQVARQAVDDKFVSHLATSAFVKVGERLVPREAVSAPMQSLPELPASLMPQPDGTPQPLFKTQLTPTRARITGVGFFDKVHGQMGVSPSNGVELHPVLKIEWL